MKVYVGITDMNWYRTLAAQPEVREVNFWKPGGEGGFKALVHGAYRDRCSVTGHKIRPTLQAAHILPVGRGGEHRVDNGLLLRSDVHTMFDRGYIGVDPSYKLHVSRRLRDEFGNGDEFYEREGSVIALPESEIDKPNKNFLTWHMDEVFLTS